MTTAVDGGFEVRWYKEADLAEMVATHAVCYPAEGWQARDFVRFADRPGQVVKVIVTEDGKVAGTLLFRNLLGDEARIARVGVLPEFRRRHAGLAAIRSLIGPQSPNPRRVYLARLRESQVPGQFLLGKAGFAYFHTEPGFFARNDGVPGREDAYWFRFERAVPARRRRQPVAAGLLMP